MATTKIHPIKTEINASIKYVLNENKTLETTLVSTFGCDKETAIDDFNAILNNSKASNPSVTAQHLIQSFKPGEVDMNTAHEIGLELADRFLKGRHQYVLATHVDKKHIHNHIIINQVSFIDYKSFKSKRENVYNIREISDALCAEYGLSIIRNIDQNKQRIDPKYTRGKYKNTFRSELKNDLDYAIRNALNYNDFLSIMNNHYFVNQQGTYTTFKHKTNGQIRPIRMERLGEGYTKIMINYRINNEFVDIKKHEFKPLERTWVKEIIDLASDEKLATQPGLRYWAIRQNNQAIIATLNRMNQLGCGSYNQLTTYVDQLEKIYEHDDKKIRELNAEMNAIKHTLSKVQDTKGKVNLCLHAEQLEGTEKHEFMIKHQISESNLMDYHDLKDELLSEGCVIDSVNDLNHLTKDLNEILENKRSRINELLSDQQREITFTNEMKYLANNYDIFIGKDPQYVDYLKTTPHHEH